MAWGGAGGGFSGPSAVASSAAAGLPFAGVPPELLERVEAILDTEPAHPTAHVPFTQVEAREAPFTLRGFLGTRKPAMAGAFALVLVETLTMQLGPLLTQRAIDKGILAKSTQVLVVTAVLYAISVVVSMIASGLRVAWTGKVGESLLYDLRVRVFAHLQRLSIDFFTGEKAGRVMTRMTSDIEALSQLFQDGIVNLAVQALTMVIVTVILFLLNPALAAVTVLLVVPTMTIATIWYRNASDRGYTKVRERIAEVLADLQESLSGIRIISAHNRRRHNVQQHRNIVGEYQSANQYTARVGAVYGPLTDLIGAAGQAVVLLVGGNMVLNGSMTIGELTAFVLYLAAFFAPIQQLVQLYTTYQSGQAAVVKLQELLATRPSVPERPGADRPAAHRRACGARPRVVRLHARTGGARGRHARHRSGRDVRVGRRDRCGEVDDREARHSLLRPDGGHRLDRWARPARRLARLTAPPARCRAAGSVPLRRFCAHERDVRPP